MQKRILSGILALVMTFVLFGCTKPEKKTAEVTEPAPQAVDVYNEARAQLDAAQKATLDVKLSTSTLVEGQTFTAEEEQVISYGALDTDTPVIELTKDVTWTEEATDSEDDPEIYAYTEIYSNGTMFVEMKEMAAFTGTVNQEFADLRYVPVVLLDAALYEDVTMQTQETTTTVNFAEPTAAEAWAMPEEGQLVDASGTALIENGSLQTMTYTLTYTYGSAEITMVVESTPRAEAQEVSVPTDTDRYTVLEGVEALPLLLENRDLVAQAQSAHITSNITYTSEAVAMVYAVGSETYIYDKDGKIKLKSKDTMEYMDSQDGEQSMLYETVYQDGKAVITTNSGLPTTQTGVKDADMRETAQEALEIVITDPNYWQAVTLTDLGGIMLVEFTYTEECGNNMQNNVNNTLFDNPAFLNSYASSYETREITGYLSLDMYTGLILSNGINYEGVHVIDGDEYVLSMELAQKFEAPAFGAYEEITGEKPEEKAPEQTAQPLFYHVTGENGQEMWLFGTIHIGDERTAYLPQEIYDAFAASDALALEFDVEAFEEQVETDTKLQQQLAKVYYYSDGSTAEQHMDPELYETALKYMKAIGDFSSYTAHMRVSLWAQSIENSYLQLGHTLHTEQGVEERLTQLAKEQEKPIRSVESGLSQSQMLSKWSEDLQELLLTESMGGTVAEYTTGAMELYELWCGGDEAALRERINEEVDTSEMTDEELAEYTAALPLLEEYEKGMETDRNTGMLKVAKQYLESGDVVFFAVGLAHLLDDTNGLVDTLRQAGYTVELVTYA
ncbi:MAG: TraB/GumN family protein [Oscillospiraceae bacterium]|nr:TraB/GumN family protein [Oscillospiraceae bacterium]